MKKIDSKILIVKRSSAMAITLVSLLTGSNTLATQELPTNRVTPVINQESLVAADADAEVVTTQAPTVDAEATLVPQVEVAATPEPQVEVAVTPEAQVEAVPTPDPQVDQIVTTPEPPTEEGRPTSSRPGSQRPPRPESPQDMTETESETPLYTQCEVDAQNVKAMQQKIFELQEAGDSNVSLMELLVIQDELKAREAVVKGLIGVWDEYNDYLSQNEQLRQENGSNHLNAKNAVGALNRLKGFIDGNSQAVSRYHLLSEAFSQFDPAQFQGKTKEEVFNYIKSSMQTSCQSGQNSAALGYCQEAARNPSFWNTMTPQVVASSNPQSSSEIIHKFIEATSVSAKDWGPTDNWIENLSTLFVDNASVNSDLLADENLSQIVSGMIEETIAECRKQVLISSDRQVDCLSDSDLIQNHPKRQVLTQKLNILNPNEDREYNNMNDIVDAYLENAQKVSSAHHENIGGTITALSELANQRTQITQQLAQGNAAIQADLEDARADLKRKSNIKMAALGRNLDSIKNSKEVFSNYMSSVPGLDMGSSQTANGIIKELMGPNAPDDIFQLTAEGTFKITDEAYNKIFTDPNFSKESLTALLETPQDKYYGKSINEAKADVATRIAAIRATQEYKDAESFKNFAWDSLLDTCKEDSEINVQEIAQPPTCRDETTSEVSSLLQVGGSLISFQNELDDQMQVTGLNERCQELYRESPSDYESNGYTSLCNEINRVDIQNTRRATESAAASQTRSQRSERRRRRIYYEDDGITPASAYTPKSNLALFLPAAATAFTTVLPMWSQSPVYQSYALQGSIAGKQEKYYNAWIEARNQSIYNQTVCLNGIFNCYMPYTTTSGVSATLGNSAFNFSQGSTVFDSTGTIFTGF